MHFTSSFTVNTCLKLFNLLPVSPTSNFYSFHNIKENLEFFSSLTCKPLQASNGFHFKYQVPVSFYIFLFLFSAVLHH